MFRKFKSNSHFRQQIALLFQHVNAQPKKYIRIKIRFHSSFRFIVQTREQKLRFGDLYFDFFEHALSQESAKPSIIEILNFFFKLCYRTFMSYFVDISFISSLTYN